MRSNAVSASGCAWRSAAPASPAGTNSAAEQRDRRRSPPRLRCRHRPDTRARPAAARSPRTRSRTTCSVPPSSAPNGELCRSSSGAGCLRRCAGAGATSDRAWISDQRVFADELRYRGVVAGMLRLEHLRVLLLERLSQLAEGRLALVKNVDVVGEADRPALAPWRARRDRSPRRSPGRSARRRSARRLRASRAAGTCRSRPASPARDACALRDLAHQARQLFAAHARRQRIVAAELGRAADGRVVRQRADDAGARIGVGRVPQALAETPRKPWCRCSAPGRRALPA